MSVLRVNHRECVMADLPRCRGVVRGDFEG